MPEIRRLGLSPPAANGNADGAGTFGGELQPARGGHRQARQLADDDTEATVAQALFHAGEQCLFVTGLDIDDTARQQTHLGQRRREQVRPCDAPEHLALRAGSDCSGKQGCCRAVDGTVATTGDFMQGCERQPSPRQSAVDLRHTEWQDLSHTAAWTFEPLDAVSKLGDDGTDDRFGHFGQMGSSGVCNMALG